MHNFSTGPKLGLVVASASMVFGCDDFTCEDYATCEPAEVGQEAGSDQVSDGGTSAASAGSPSETTGTASSEATAEHSESSTAAITDGGLGATGGSTMAQDSSAHQLVDDGAVGAHSTHDGTYVDASVDASLDSATAEQLTDNEHSTSDLFDSGEQNEDARATSTDANSVDADGTLPEADGGSEHTSDASPDVDCNPAMPFGEPSEIGTINLVGEDERVMVAPDGLTLYVQYGSQSAIYVVTRHRGSVDFGVPTRYFAFDPLLESDSTLHLRSTTANRLTVYLSSDTWGEPIHSAYRDNEADDFLQSVALEELAAFDISLASPRVTPDGERVYGFLPAAYTIWAAERQPNGFSEPVEVVAANDSSIFHGTDNFILSASERVLYFTATSLGDESFFENPVIARADRATASDSFANWRVVDSLDGPSYDEPLWVSDDDCEIIFRRQDSLGDDESEFTYDIFVARRGS